MYAFIYSNLVFNIRKIYIAIHVTYHIISYIYIDIIMYVYLITYYFWLGGGTHTCRMTETEEYEWICCTKKKWARSRKTLCCKVNRSNEMNYSQLDRKGSWWGGEVGKFGEDHRGGGGGGEVGISKTTTEREEEEEEEWDEEEEEEEEEGPERRRRTALR